MKQHWVCVSTCANLDVFFLINCSVTTAANLCSMSHPWLRRDIDTPWNMCFCAKVFKHSSHTKRKKCLIRWVRPRRWRYFSSRFLVLGCCPKNKSIAHFGQLHTPKPTHTLSKPPHLPAWPWLLGGLFGRLWLTERTRFPTLSETQVSGKIRFRFFSNFNLFFLFCQHVHSKCPSLSSLIKCRIRSYQWHMTLAQGLFKRTSHSHVSVDFRETGEVFTTPPTR